MKTAPDTLNQDAAARHAARVGEVRPLLPPEVPQCGTALQVALAAIARLTDLRRPQARVLHHRRPTEAVSMASKPRSRT